MRRSFSFLPLAAILLLAGCAGYTLGPAKPVALAGIDSIAVPVFANDTYEPRLEVPATSAVVRQFQLDGTYRISTADAADAVLNGKLLSVTRNPARSVRGNVISTLEFDVEIAMTYELVDQRTGRKLARGTVVGGSTFFVNNDVTLDQKQALPRAIQELSVRLVSQVAEGW